MKINTHRFYRNREAVIKGAALFLLDAVLVIACMAGALWMRFDFSFTSIEPVFLESMYTQNMIYTQNETLEIQS